MTDSASVSQLMRMIDIQSVACLGTEPVYRPAPIVRSAIRRVATTAELREANRCPASDPLAQYLGACGPKHREGSEHR